MKFNASNLLYTVFFVIFLGQVNMAEGAPLDVSKESARIGRHFKGVRVYYSNFGGVPHKASVSGIEPPKWKGDSYGPPLRKLLLEAGAIIIPITQAKFNDTQIAYDWDYTTLSVAISRKGKVLFNHEYKFTEGYWGDRSLVLESLFIRDLDSEDIF